MTDLENDPWGDWEQVQPARTDTVLPRKVVPPVKADPVAVALILGIAVIVLGVLFGLAAWPVAGES